MKSIIYKNYQLIPCDNAIGKFDLIGVKIRKKRDSEETYEAEDLIGYGFTLEQGVQNIIFLEVENSRTEEKITLKEYFEQFKKVKNEVISEIKNLLNVKIN